MKDYAKDTEKKDREIASLKEQLQSCKCHFVSAELSSEEIRVEERQQSTSHGE